MTDKCAETVNHIGVEFFILIGQNVLNRSDKEKQVYIKPINIHCFKLQVV